MIGFLRGVLMDKRPPQLLLDVQGVGYELEAPMSTFYALPEVGSEASLYTHLVVREDAHTLFAFGSDAERSLFRNLIKVNGVGAKLALTLLSGMSVADFARCVNGEDAAALVRLPGIGRKTAERLIIELRDRLPQTGAVASLGIEPGCGHVQGQTAPVQEALSALIALGYKPPEASRMVRAVEDTDLSSEDIIRKALRAAVKP